MSRDLSEITIGKIVAPFGIKGEMKVVVLTEFPERFEAGREVILRPVNGERRRLRIERSREGKGGITLKLNGIDTREDVEVLRNAEFVIEERDLPTLEEGRYYVFDIIGLTVVTDDGREQGVVVDILQGGSNDVYVTSTGLLIPALRAIVTKVDVAGGKIIIHPMPGLLPEDD